MKCPFCSHPDTQVVETREAEDGASSAAAASAAGALRFTTYERPEVSFPAIVKKDGRRIEYERAKLLGSFKIALRKRPVSTEQIDAAIERIEERLRNLGEREFLQPPGRDGDARAQAARQGRLHPYASVYRSFEVWTISRTSWMRCAIPADQAGRTKKAALGRPLVPGGAFRARRQGWEPGPNPVPHWARWRSAWSITTGPAAPRRWALRGCRRGGRGGPW
ncbi:Otogelin [Manis javanica]|nr:Otogelin [Manis javanica]